MFCHWPNTCENPDICCHDCGVKYCAMRCHDSTQKCIYLKDAEGRFINLPDKEVKEVAPSKKVMLTTVTDVFQTQPSHLINKFKVCINSGNNRGKDYFFTDLFAAKRKARILEERQKQHRKSIIIQAAMTDLGEAYDLCNRIEY